MLSPENPSCSPEVLGTTGTHPLLLLTLAAASVPVLRLLLSSLFFFFSPVAQSESAVCRPVGMWDWT